MRKITSVFFMLTAALFFSGVCKAQNDYQQRYDNCNLDRSKLLNKLNALKAEEQNALDDIRNGLFCSDCKRSKTEIEKSGTNFNQHIQEGAKGGRRVVAATQQQIADKTKEYNDKIHNLEVDVDSKRLDCERINADYQKNQRDKQLQAQQNAQAQQKAQVQAQQTAQAQAQAQQRQEYEAAQARAAQELQRLRDLQAQRAAAMAVTTANFQNEVANNNSVTQQRLDEQRANGTLDDVPVDTHKDEARSISGTNSKDLSDEAFKALSILKRTGGEGVNYLQNKVASVLKDRVVDTYNRQIDQMKPLFGGDYQQEEKPAGIWAGVKTKIADDVVQLVKNKILRWDNEHGGGVLNRIYAPFQKIQDEVSNYDERTLVKFNEENMDFIGRGIDNITSDADPAEFDKVSDQFFQNTPKRLVGVLRKWIPGGKTALLDEFKWW
jgi:hypothetical protein